MEWTKEQKQIINSRAKNLLVSASAGSGKTTVMIERIIALLQRGYKIEDFLVSTFTKASAADMKEKLLKKLRESNDMYLRSQIKKLPDADITNIDSFCKKLLSQYFYAVGIDPNFELMSESESRGVLNSALDEVIREYEMANDEEFIILRNFLTVNRQDTKFRECIKKLYYYATICPEPDEILSELQSSDTNTYVAKKIAKDKEKLLEKIQRYAEICKTAGFERNYIGSQKLYECVKNDDKNLPTLSGKIGEFEHLKAGFDDLKSQAKELLNIPASSPSSVTNVNKISQITLRLKKAYDQRKKRTSRLDFGDLEQYAYKLLQQPDIAKEISDKYKFVFVDEYQDINPLQENIINLITANKFMVGDLKQSIYAFRGCQPDIFAQRALRYANNDGGKLVLLNVNYRCGQRIVDFVNDVFDVAMTSENCGVDYKQEAHLVAKSEKKGFTPRIVCYENIKDEKSGLYDIQSADIVCPEAQGVADRIAELVAGIEQDNQVRKFGFGEIAVLVRAETQDVAALMSHLRQRAIPYYFSRKVKFSNVKQVKMLISCLKLINNNQDEIALAGAMLSYMGEFTPDQLLTIKSGKKSFYEAVFDRQTNEKSNADEVIKQNNEINQHLEKKLSKFLQKLFRYNLLSTQLSVDELASIIIEENNFFLHTFASNGDAEGLDEFLNYITESPLKGNLNSFLVDFESSEPDFVSHGSDNAVKIMTIHGSKGLEFPAVILMGAGRDFNFTDSGQPLIIESGKVAIKGFDGICGREYETDIYRLLLNEKVDNEKAEELRLLYVALTRAKEFLEIFGTGKKGYLKILEHTLTKYGATPQQGKEFCIKNRVPSFIKNDTLTNLISQKLAFKMPKVTSLQKTYVTKITHEEDKTSQTSLFSAPQNASNIDKETQNALNTNDETQNAKSTLQNIEKMSDKFNKGYEQVAEKALIAKKTGVDEPSESIFSEQIQFDAAVFKGTAYHTAMEEIDFENFEQSYQNLPDSVKNLVEKSKIKVAVENVSRLVQGMTIYKEQPFIVPIEMEQSKLLGEKTLVQGVIDLMAVKDDECIIIDYKTGSEDYAFCQKNIRQVEFYKKAVEDTLNLKTKAYIYSFATGKIKLLTSQN